MLKKTPLNITLIVLLILASVLCNPAQKIRSYFVFFQYTCEKLTSGDTNFRPIVQATLCGIYNSDHKGSKLEESLRTFGLIHLLVASGANIHFVNSFIKFWPYQAQPILRSLLFTLLLSASGLATPLFRAFIQIQLKAVSDNYSFGLSHFRRVTFANLIYLLLFPMDLFSLSFQLSAVASYSLALLSHSPFGLHIFIFLFMTPLLSRFQIQDPVSILCNLMIAPILGPLLLGLSFLIGFFPLIAKPLDPLLMVLIDTLPSSSHLKDLSLSSFSSKSFAFYSTAYFIFCICLFEALYFLKIFNYQRHMK